MSDEGSREDQPSPAHQKNKHWYSWCIKRTKRYLEDYRTNKKQETATDKAARRTANATNGLVFFTIGLVVVGYLQYRVISRQLKQMREDGAQTSAAARAAEISARAAKDAVDLDRAWIGAPKIAFTLPNKTYSFTYTLKNVGKSPVRGIYMITQTYTSEEYNSTYASKYFERLAREGRAAFGKRDRLSPTKHLLVPQEEVIIPTAGAAKAAITEQQAAEATEKGAAFYILGSIVYGSGRDDEANAKEFMRATAFKAEFHMRNGSPSVESVWAFDAD